MVKNLCFLETQDDFFKCFVLCTTHRYSVYCQRVAKDPENIQFDFPSKKSKTDQLSK